MIKLNLNRHDIAGLMKMLPGDIGAWDDDALILRVGGKDISLKELNIELTTIASWNGIEAEVSCHGKGDSLDIDVELQS